MKNKSVNALRITVLSNLHWLFLYFGIDEQGQPVSPSQFLSDKDEDRCLTHWLHHKAAAVAPRTAMFTHWMKVIDDIVTRTKMLLRSCCCWANFLDMWSFETLVLSKYYIRRQTSLRLLFMKTDKFWILDWKTHKFVDIILENTETSVWILCWERAEVYKCKLHIIVPP